MHFIRISDIERNGPIVQIMANPIIYTQMIRVGQDLELIIEGIRMKVNVDLRLKDIPGQLVRALEPISANDGNIRGVVHHHDEEVGGRIQVNVTFEVRSEPILAKVLQIWKEREIDVAKIDAIFETYRVEYLLVGDISSKELEGITDSLETIEGIASIDIRYAGSSSSRSRSAMITGKATKKDTIKTLDDYFIKRSEKKGYTLVRGLE